MKKKLLVTGLIVVVLAVIAIAVAISNHRSSIFTVENNDDGTIEVTAQNAAQDASGVGYITLEEGQMLMVRTTLTDHSTVGIEVLPAETDATTKTLLNEEFTAVDARHFEMPAGRYTIRITARKGATGSISIWAGGDDN